MELLYHELSLSRLIKPNLYCSSGGGQSQGSEQGSIPLRISFSSFYDHNRTNLLSGSPLETFPDLSVRNSWSRRCQPDVSGFYCHQPKLIFPTTRWYITLLCASRSKYYYCLSTHHYSSLYCSQSTHCLWQENHEVEYEIPFARSRATILYSSIGRSVRIMHRCYAGFFPHLWCFRSS